MSAAHVMLLERDREVATLRDALASAARGRGGATVIAGPAGIGKTALLEFACAGTELAVLQARAAYGEANFAYGVVRQLLEPAVARTPQDRSDELFAAGAAPARRVIGASVAEATSGPGQDVSFGVLHGLFWLTANLAARAPLVLCVDDVQWCDPPSIRYLTHLARRVEDLPVAIVATLRTGDPETSSPLLGELLDVPGVQTLAPRPLSADAVAELVRAQVDPQADPVVCAACHRLTAGNPLYLRQVLLSLADDPDLDPADVRPAPIGRYVLRRLETLGAGATELAGVLSVMGTGPLAAAAEVAGLEPAAAHELADALVAADVLAAVDPFHFTHPVVRGAIEDALPATRREAIHLAAAQLLGSGAAVEDAAAHVHELRPAARDWCVEVLRTAAREALGRGAPEVAVRHLARAVAEPPPERLLAAVLGELGVAEEHAGRPEALDHLRAAVDAAVGPAARAEATLTLAAALVSGFRIEDGLRALRHGLEELGDAEPQLALLLEAELLAVGLGHPRYGALFADRLDRLEVRASEESPARGFFLAALTLMAVNRNSRQDGATLAQAALGELALSRMPPRLQQHAVGVLFFPLLAMDEFPTLEMLLDLTWPMAQEGGVTADLVWGHGLRAHVAARMARLAEAETHGRTALEIALAHHMRGAAGWFAAPVIDALVDRGDLDAAEELLGSVPPVEVIEGRTMLFPARGRLRLAQGRHEEALEDFTRAGEEYESPAPQAIHMLTPAYGHWRSGAALALLALDRHQQAREMAHSELALARDFGAPRALCIALRAAATVERGDVGIRLLEEAVAATEGSSAVLERARALVALGSLLRRERHATAARQPLRAGLDLAVTAGARALATYARDELVAAGGRPRRERTTGRDALTGAELRVAQLAAAGATNREIAQQLFVSMKTVEMHLGRAYRKLGIASRAQLQRALGIE